MKLKVSYFARASDAVPKEDTVEYPSDFERFRVGGTKDGTAWSPAHFTKPGRINENVDSMCALVLDLDEADIERAVAALEPYDYIIHATWTGGNYRVVLPFKELVSVPAWNAWWNRLAPAVGADPSCKDPARLYYWPSVPEPGDEEFTHHAGKMLEGDAPVPPKTPTKAPAPPPAPTVTDATPLATTSLWDTAVAYPEVLAECGFLQECKDKAATLPEPRWRAWLDILRLVEGGRPVAHEVGSVYPTYSKPETDAKFDSRQGSAPLSCAYIASLGGEACLACPHREEGSNPTSLCISKKRATQGTATQDAYLDAVARLEAAKADVATHRFDVSIEEKAKAQLRLEQARAHLKAEKKRVAKEETRSSGDDKQTATIGTLLSLIKESDELRDRIAWDTFGQRLLVRDESDEWIRFEDHHAVEWAAHMEYTYGVAPTSLRMYEVLASAGRANRIHPLQQALSELEWDGTERIHRFLLDGCGAFGRPDLERISRLFLVGMAARAFRPGCKHDSMLILCGKQGRHKSTGFRQLVEFPQYHGFGKWFRDDEISFGNRDAAIQIQGVWLQEIAELQSLRKAEMDDVKAFLSRQEDDIIPRYGRVSANYPRTTCFVGTVNDDEFLVDATGARRFWPTRIGRVNLDWINENRSQIWAEAVHAFRAGERWYIDDDEGQDVAEEQAMAFTATDPWAELIARWIVRKNVERASLSDALETGVGMPLSTTTKKERDRMGKVFKSLQCERLPNAVWREGARVYVYDTTAVLRANDAQKIIAFPVAAALSAVK